MSNHNGKILIGIKPICAYLGNMDRKTLHVFFDMGLPHTVVNRRIYAHTDNIDEFFARLTRRRSKAGDLQDIDD